MNFPVIKKTIIYSIYLSNIFYQNNIIIRILHQIKSLIFMIALNIQIFHIVIFNQFFIYFYFTCIFII
jgi:hypothetical protein